MAYRTVHTHFWTDPVVRQLPTDGKLLFLYLITNPHAHLSGCYYLPISTIAHETGIKEARINTLFDTLSHTKNGIQGKAGCIITDTLTGLIWIKKMFAYQGKGEKAQRSAANHLNTLHKSPLIKAFLDSYPAVKQYCKDTLLDTLSHTVEQGDARVGPPNQDQDQDQEKDSAGQAHRAANDSKEFEEFWKVYPSRGGKKLYRKQAGTLFEKLSVADQILCVAATKVYAAYCAKQQRTPKDPPRFLHGKDGSMWREFIPVATTTPAKSKALTPPPPLTMTPEQLTGLEQFTAAISKGAILS